jgi:hypothetical protein
LFNLYKFEPPDAQRINTVLKNNVYFARPARFNDLRDCTQPINGNTSDRSFDDTKIRAAALKLYEDYDLANNGAWLLDENCLNHIRDWAGGGEGPNEWPGNHVRERVAKFGITCFSKLWDNVLMWSHYAKKHEGFCVEYEYEPWQLSACEFSMMPVTYSSELPLLNLTEVLFAPLEATRRLLCTKTVDWAYEREYRLIYFPLAAVDATPEQSTVALPAGLKVKSIIAGARTTEADKTRLREVASKLDVPFDVLVEEHYSGRLRREPQSGTVVCPV